MKIKSGTNFGALGLSLSLALMMSGCNQHGDSSNNSPQDDDQHNYLQTGFNINYLTKNSWYGVATNEVLTTCLSKLNFSTNKVVNLTFYAEDDGVTLESNDLLYSVENDYSLSIDDHDVFHYLSHNEDEFTTSEAQFFRIYSDAMNFAESNQANCRMSIPK